MAYRQNYLVMYQAHKHRYLITPPYTSPYKGHTENAVLEKQGFEEKPVERWDLVRGRLKEKCFLEMFSKNDT